MEITVNLDGLRDAIAKVETAVNAQILYGRHREEIIEWVPSKLLLVYDKTFGSNVSDMMVKVRDAKSSIQDVLNLNERTARQEYRKLASKLLRDLFGVDMPGKVTLRGEDHNTHDFCITDIRRVSGNDLSNLSLTVATSSRNGQITTTETLRYRAGRFIVLSDIF